MGFEGRVYRAEGGGEGGREMKGEKKAFLT